MPNPPKALGVKRKYFPRERQSAAFLWPDFRTRVAAAEENTPRRSGLVIGDRSMRAICCCARRDEWIRDDRRADSYNCDEDSPLTSRGSERGARRIDNATDPDPKEKIKTAIWPGSRNGP
jgi:hypothetical protein